MCSTGVNSHSSREHLPLVGEFMASELSIWGLNDIEVGDQLRGQRMGEAARAS